jgi:hypothetical protein
MKMVGGIPLYEQGAGVHNSKVNMTLVRILTALHEILPRKYTSRRFNKKI